MFNNLYEDIGDKLTTWAKYLFVIEVVFSIVAALSLFSFDLWVLGLLILILGPVFSLFSSWALYAFGQLVDDVHALRVNKESILTAHSDNEESAPPALITQGKHVCDYCMRHKTCFKISLQDDGEVYHRYACEKCAKRNGYI